MCKENSAGLEILQNTLEDGFSALKLPLNGKALEAFQTYYRLLEEWGARMNLTAIRGEEQVATLHFLDSVALLKLLPFSNATVADIGSGAGFPGLPLKIAEPSMKLTLVDALQKRVTFLQEVSKETGASALCLHARAEELARDPKYRDGYQIVVSRAVARLNLLCELCLPLVQPGGVFLAMKGAAAEEELVEAMSAIQKLGGRLDTVKEYIVPTTQVVHRAVLIRKLSATPAPYPRKYAKIQKNPL